MIETVLLGLLGIFAYVQVGYRLGQLSWWTWTNKGAPKILRALLFPAHYFFNNTVGMAHVEPHHMGEGEYLWIARSWRRGKDEAEITRQNYYFLMAMLWPVKLAFNFPGIIILGIALGFQGATKILETGIKLGAQGAIKILKAMMFGPDWAARKAWNYFGQLNRKALSAPGGTTTPVAICALRASDDAAK